MKTFLKVIGALLSVVVLGYGFVQLQFQQKSQKVYIPPKINIHEKVLAADPELGHRIYAVRSGCIDCHGEKLGGKLIMDAPPMGRIFGANISPKELKNWSDDEIAVAIRYGIHRSGRSLMFMPSFDYEGLSEGDIAAVIAYLRAQPEVESENPPNTFGPIARIMGVLGKMPVLFPAEFVDPAKGFAAKPAEGATFEFGQYLANTCIGCHGKNYTGGKIPGGDPSWPEAAPIRLGAQGGWTEDAFKQMIRTGVSHLTGKALRPPMPIHLLRQMNDVEIQSLWIYLSSLK